MKLKFTINRTGAGFALERKLFLDGKDCKSASSNLSRDLTATTSESSHHGLFSERGTLYRNSLSVDFDFGFRLEMINYADAKEFLLELKRRVDWVNKAFRDKYPLHSSESEIEIEPAVQITEKEDTPAEPLTVY